MTLLYLYCAAMGSFLVGGVLIHDTSPFADMGGSRYEWRARRRVLGQVLFVIGAVCLFCALIGQVMLYHPTP